jgi:hypothetical protein
MSQFSEQVLRLWCRYFHSDIYAPVHGEYVCQTCQRRWPVPWELAQLTTPTHTVVSRTRSAQPATTQPEAA